MTAFGLKFRQILRHGVASRPTKNGTIELAGAERKIGLHRYSTGAAGGLSRVRRKSGVQNIANQTDLRKVKLHGEWVVRELEMVITSQPTGWWIIHQPIRLRWT